MPRIRNTRPRAARAAASTKATGRANKKMPTEGMINTAVNEAFLQCGLSPLTQIDTSSAPATLRTQDISCGRGGGVNHRPGNMAYLKVIDTLKPLYRTSEKLTKHAIMQAVFRELTKQNRRFMKQVAPATQSGSPWVELEKSKALKKIGQCLRESHQARSTAQAPTSTKRSQPENNTSIAKKRRVRFSSKVCYHPAESPETTAPMRNSSASVRPSSPGHQPTPEPIPIPIPTTTTTTAPTQTSEPVGIATPNPSHMPMEMPQALPDMGEELMAFFDNTLVRAMTGEPIPIELFQVGDKKPNWLPTECSATPPIEDILKEPTFSDSEMPS